MQPTIFLRDWFDPIEKGVRERVRGFIEELIEAELEEALSRPRYGRAAPTGPGMRPVDTGTATDRAR
jgi:putative transposase